MSINQIIELALPLLVSAITALLQQDHLAEQWNALIAIALVILSGIGTAFLGGHLTGNVSVDILTVAGACVALQTVPWATPLFDWLNAHSQLVKPVAQLITEVAPVKSTAQPYVEVAPLSEKKAS